MMFDSLQSSAYPMDVDEYMQQPRTPLSHKCFTNHTPVAEVDAAKFNMKRLQPKSSISKTKSTLRKSSPAKNNQVGKTVRKFGTSALRNKIQAAKMKTMMGKAVARLEGILNSRSVTVNKPNSVITTQILKKPERGGSREVPKVKRVHSDEALNASEMQVGFSEAVPAFEALVAAGKIPSNQNGNNSACFGENDVASEECVANRVEERDTELSEIEHMMAKWNENCLEMEMNYLDEISRTCAAHAMAEWLRLFPDSKLFDKVKKDDLFCERNPFAEIPRRSSSYEPETPRDPELTPEQHIMAVENERMLQLEVEYVEHISRRHAYSSKALWRMKFPGWSPYRSVSDSAERPAVLRGAELRHDACLSADGPKYRYVRC